MCFSIISRVSYYQETCWLVMCFQQYCSCYTIVWYRYHCWCVLIHTSAGTLTTEKGKGRERNREFLPRFRSRDSERFCSRLIPNRSQRPRFRSRAGIDRFCSHRSHGIDPQMIPASSGNWLEAMFKWAEFCCIKEKDFTQLLQAWLVGLGVKTPISGAFLCDIKSLGDMQLTRTKHVSS